MDCREQALKLLSFSDRTEKELRGRLEEKGYNGEEIDDAVAFLIGYDYIDDARYARKYASDSIRLKGHGPGRIRSELLRKGISREIVDQVLEELELDPREQLEAIMDKRFANADLGNPRERNRIFGYFSRRGYSLHDIIGVINSRSSFKDIDFEE